MRTHFAWVAALLLTAACTITPEEATTPGEGGAGGADGTSGPIPCDDLTEAGRCQDGQLLYCKDDIQQEIDCAAVGMVCEVNDGQADCTDLTRSASCGDLTPLGECSGALLNYCDEVTSDLGAVPRTINCAAYGQVCDPTGATDDGAICVPHGPCPENLDENGTCDSNELRFCENDELYVFDCGVDECHNVGGFADCFMPGVTDGCGDETEAGRCDGETVVACLGNVVTREDCEVLGMACEQSAGGAQCAETCPTSCPTGWSCTGSRCAPPTVPQRDWTVAVYVVGDNNLADAGWQDLREMERVGSTSAVQIVTEFELSPVFSRLAPDEYQTGVYRMPIRADGNESVLSSVSESVRFDNRNMSDPKHLSEFMSWAAETYPAKRYALVIWDHGLGWQGGFVDTGSSGEMSLRDLVDGVRDSGVHLDLLGFDACLMGLHDVAMSFRGLSDILVASEDVEPGAGYPYDWVLQKLVERPGMPAAELGTVIVDEYTKYYSSGFRQRSTTQAAIDLSQMQSVNRQLADFAGGVLKSLGPTRTDVANAVRDSEMLRFRDRDLADLSSMLTSFGSVPGQVGGSADGLDSWFASSGAVVKSTGTRENEGASGLAMYLPEQAFSWYSTGSFDDYRNSTSFLPMQTWHGLVGSLTSDDNVKADPSAQATDWFSIVLSWGDEPDGAESGADLDLYVYEPNGDFGTPLNGTVTQNGMLSSDSFDSGVSEESYELLSNHMPGTYIVLVRFHDGPAGEKAYPRLRVYRNDLPGGSRTLVRGKVEDRELVEYPMDNSAPLNEVITEENFEAVLDLEYSNIWYAVTIEVQ